MERWGRCAQVAFALATGVGLLSGCNSGGASGSGSPARASATPYVLTPGQTPSGGPLSISKVGDWPAGALQFGTNVRVSVVADQYTTTAAGLPGPTEHAGVMYFQSDSAATTLPAGAPGAWYRLDFTTGAVPSPERVSSESLAPCLGGSGTNWQPTLFYRDLRNGRTAFLIYEAPGPDGACGNQDVMRVINFYDASTTPPATLPQQPIAALYSDAGIFAGMLMQDARGLLWLTDTDSFAGERVIAANVYAPLSSALATTNVGSTYLRGSSVLLLTINHSGGQTSLPEVRRLDASGAVAASLYDHAPTPGGSPEFLGQSVSDATTLYFFDGYTDPADASNPVHVRLVGVPRDGSAPGQVVGDYPYNFQTLVGLTDHYVIAADSSNGFLRLPRTPGAAVPPAITAVQQFLTVTHGLIFGDGAGTPGQPIAIAADETGAVATIPSSFWAGYRLGPIPANVFTPEVGPSSLVFYTGDTTTLPGTFKDATFYEVGFDGSAPVPFTRENGTAADFSFSYANVIGDGTNAELGSGATGPKFGFDFAQHKVFVLQ